MRSTKLDTKEIEGAQAGSLLKGPKTKRITNPMESNYQVPGWTELKDGENPYSISKKDAEKKAT